jgi:hypothetical protein
VVDGLAYNDPETDRNEEGIPMRKDEFASTGSDEPNWDDAVALEPEEAAAIQVDPEVEDFAPAIPGFELEPDAEEDEPEPVDHDPDFDDDAEMSLLHDLGIDLDAPDGQPGPGLDFHFELEPDAEDPVDDEVAV